jgi:hypothetical protein
MMVVEVTRLVGEGVLSR